jgi:hypothetical protein
MIWQLQRYLELLFPNEIFYVNMRYRQFPDSEVPDRNILIQEMTGTENAWYKWKQKILQFVIRDIDQVSAKALTDIIYNELHGRFGLELPGVTVGAIVYPKIKTGQISSQTTPQSLGEDENGRPEFSFTMKILYV